MSLFDYLKRKPQEPSHGAASLDPSRPVTVRDLETVGSTLIEHWYALEKKRERNRSIRRLIVLGLFVAGVFFVLNGSGDDRVVLNHTSLDKPFAGVSGGKGTGRVAVIKISGGIDGDYLGDNSPENTVRVLRESFVQAEGEKKLAGVLLLIDSPGGGANASAQLYRLTKRFRKAHPDIPVLAYVSQGAYSGGYYAALGAERIIVDPEAVVANIGIIQRLFNTSVLGNTIGVTENEVATGPRKNAGSQWRELSREDRRMMSRASHTAFLHFLEAVSDSRGIPVETLLREATQAQGRTSGAWFSSTDALAGKLVDEIIPIEDFFEHAAPAFAEKKKFSEIEYVSFEKDTDTISGAVSKSAQALAGGMLRSLKHEALRNGKSIRAE